MAILKVYGEYHYDRNDCERKEEFDKKACRGEINFLREGKDFSLEEAKKNVYGIEEPIICIFVNSLMNYTNLLFKVDQLVEDYGGKPKPEEIKDFVKYMGEQKKDKAVFKRVVINYMVTIRTLLDLNKPTVEKIWELFKLRDKAMCESFNEPDGAIKEFFKFSGKYCRKLYDFKVVNGPITEEEYSSEFYVDFFGVIEKFNLFLQKIFPILLELVKNEHASAKGKDLTLGRLKAFIADKKSYGKADETEFMHDVAVTRRNQIFVDNIFNILSNVNNGKDFICVVGNAHIEGMEKLINNDKRFKQIKVEFIRKRPRDEGTVSAGSGSSNSSLNASQAGAQSVVAMKAGDSISAEDSKAATSDDGAVKEPPTKKQRHFEANTPVGLDKSKTEENKAENEIKPSNLTAVSHQRSPFFEGQHAGTVSPTTRKRPRGEETAPASNSSSNSGLNASQTGVQSAVTMEAGDSTAAEDSKAATGDDGAIKEPPNKRQRR